MYFDFNQILEIYRVASNTIANKFVNNKGITNISLACCVIVHAFFLLTSFKISFLWKQNHSDNQFGSRSGPTF